MFFFQLSVWMWELDHKEGEHWQSDAFELWCLRTLESSLGCKEIQPVNAQGNHLWIFIERTDAKAEAPIIWPPDLKSWLIGKDTDVGKDWRQKEMGMAKNKFVR